MSPSHITMEALEDVGNIPLLGYTVAWRFSGIEVQHADLKQRLTDAGFGAYLPDKPTARTALRRAILEWSAARAAAGHGPAVKSGVSDVDDTGTGKAQRALIRVINTKTTAWMVFVIIAEDIDLTAYGLSFDTDLRILLEKATGRLICTTQQRGDASTIHQAPHITAALAPHWAKHREQHTSGDVSRVVSAIVKDLQAVTLRDGGGFYFVPISQRDTLLRLRTFVADLPVREGQAPFMLVLPQIDVQSARRQLAHAAHTDFMDELAAMEKDLQRFLDAKPGTVKAQTIAERLVAFRLTREKAHAYLDLMGMRQESIVKRLDDLTAKAKTIVLNGTISDAADEAPSDQEVGNPPDPPPIPSLKRHPPRPPALAQAA
jgi:hypothetical protein